MRESTGAREPEDFNAVLRSLGPMDLAVQPDLETDRLSLRPVSENDVPSLWALWTDPAVRRFLWDDRVISRAEAEATVADCVALTPRGLGLWTLWARAHASSNRTTGDFPPVRRLIGCAGLLPVSTAAQSEPRLAGLVEPLVALAPDVWGRGYAIETLRALLRHATATLGLELLARVTDVPNVSSDRMLRRGGFVPLSEVAGPRCRLRTYLYRRDTRGDQE